MTPFVDVGIVFRAPGRSQGAPGVNPASETDGPTAGETARAVFDVATDRAYGRPISEVFTFTPPLPPDVGYRWADASTFEVIVGPSGAGVDGASLLVGGTTLRLHAGSVRNERVAARALGQPSAPETYTPEANVTLSGSFGTAEPPRLTAFVPSDPANADTVFGDGDQLALEFDVFTDQTGQLSSREAVDALFGFSSPLGSDYSGEWRECYDELLQCRAFTITITDAKMPRKTDRPPEVGKTLAWVKPPDPNSQAQPLNWGGVRSASKISPFSTHAVALGASNYSEPTPLAPFLDLGRRRLLFLQRTQA